MQNNYKIFAPSTFDSADFDWLFKVVSTAQRQYSPNPAVRYRVLARECASIFEASDKENSQQTRLLKRAVCLSLLADISEQGSLIDMEDGEIRIRPAVSVTANKETQEQGKRRLRAGLQRSSNRQIAEPSVQKFIKMMQRPRQHDGKTVSIFSLVDDGQDLSQLLLEATTKTGVARQRALSKNIDPVVQECSSGTRCDFTGMKLQDIWRYFRHTWSLHYNPLPGRTMRFLIRNTARPYAPVIGIAMLASPSANLLSRDEWIGWQLDEIVEGLAQNRWSAETVCRSLVETLRDAISDIRTDDLLVDAELTDPTINTFFKLEQTVIRAQSQRQNDLANGREDGLVDIRCIKDNQRTDDAWKALSDTALYVKKRAESLLPLLQALKYFQDAGCDKEPAAVIYEALVDRNGRKMVQLALNELKKRRLASEVADVAVCGAIPPYNHLLGGKLVTLLMGSKEVQQIYNERYSNQPSEIASQLAGRTIVRPSILKALTTTSLYGVGSSQYNRLKLLQKTHSKLPHDVVWEELRRSEGFTITHISNETVSFMRQLGIAHYGRRRINSVFGEGSSPRTRQVREALNLLGINNDDLLKQPVGRRVYGCELYPGAKDELLGFVAPKKRSILPSAKEISKAWQDRWLAKRIEKTDTLQHVAEADGKTVARELGNRAKDALLESQKEREMLSSTSQPSLPLDEFSLSTI